MQINGQGNDFIATLYNAVQDKRADNVQFGFGVKMCNMGGQRRGVRFVQSNAMVGDGIRKALLVSLGRAGLSATTMGKIRAMLDGTRERVSQGLAMERPVSGRTIRQIFDMAIPESRSGLFGGIQAVRDGSRVCYDTFPNAYNGSLKTPQPSPQQLQAQQRAAQQRAMQQREAQQLKWSLPSAPKTKLTPGKPWAQPAAKRMRIADAMANLALKRYKLSFQEFQGLKTYLEFNPQVMDEMAQYVGDKASQFCLLDDVVDKAICPDRSSRRW